MSESIADRAEYLRDTSSALLSESERIVAGISPEAEAHVLEMAANREAQKRIDWANHRIENKSLDGLTEGRLRQKRDALQEDAHAELAVGDVADTLDLEDPDERQRVNEIAELTAQIRELESDDVDRHNDLYEQSLREKRERLAELKSFEDKETKRAELQSQLDALEGQDGLVAEKQRKALENELAALEGD